MCVESSLRDAENLAKLELEHWSVSKNGTYILVPDTTMKRGFLGYSKKKPADSRTIHKSTREESIDTLQAASIDSVNQKSINNIVVPCAVIEVEFPIPPDKSVHLDSYSEILDDHQHVEASQRGLRFQDEVYKVPAEPVSVDTDRIPSIDTNKPASIDTTTSPSIDTTPSTSIGAITSPSIDTGRLSEQKEFDMVSGNPECAADASHSHFQSFEHSLLLR
ncbi:hypothetical protein DY000_02031743 [Brassica cretica]|uniref:Uncharacterized protein n=1 Tax=Brassica cretica TaxID=69181 RepID=A0ABQ7E0M9_BRACR|nr:hypothetical protein DY000_02031743 [Brassica cretica]